jgi:hypothetical protein
LCLDWILIVGRRRFEQVVRAIVDMHKDIRGDDLVAVVAGNNKRRG